MAMIKEGESYVSNAHYRLGIEIQGCIHDLHALGKSRSAKADLGGPHDKHKRYIDSVRS